MFAADVHVEVGLHAVIVEQRVVDVEQEDEVVHHVAIAPSPACGLRHGPSAPISASASSGPQVPDS